MDRRIILIGAIIAVISILLLVLYVPITTLSATQLSEQYNKSNGTYAYSEGTIQKISGTIEAIRYIPSFNLTLVTLNNGDGSWLAVFGNVTSKLNVGNDIIAVATLIKLQFPLRVYLDVITGSFLQYAWFCNVHNIIFSGSYDLFFSIFIVLGVLIALFGVFRKRQ
ncbi:MAG: hypothetical protein ACP5FQ_06680 [Thermoplasmata archaeon]